MESARAMTLAVQVQRDNPSGSAVLDWSGGVIVNTSHTKSLALNRSSELGSKACALGELLVHLFE